MGPAVVVEAHDRDLFGEGEQRSDVIAMIVRRPHVVDLPHSGGLEGIENAAEIALPRVAAVDQQRLSRRADEERRLPALGIDVVDVQRSRLVLRRQAHDPGCQE